MPRLEGNEIKITFNEDDQPIVETFKGDGWKANDIKAVNRLIQQAYRDWIRKIRRKETKKSNPLLG